MTDRHAARLLTAIALTGVTMLSAAACSDGGSSADSNESPGTGGRSVLSTHDTDAVGEVFADASGRTVYSADEEDGKVTCTGACLQFWHPVMLDSAHVSQPPSGDERFGTITRPDDGKIQITYDHKPVYTFAEDEKPGDAKGDGFKDGFAGHDFTWHAVHSGAAGAAPSMSGPRASTSGGYGY
ncbi:COG4315 family predicted lipoprotein [Streptomyces sp. Tue6028]|uniref:COG4315 family predicted lipoprotein n=1 Tax=Streptomyces sp. Tue6028 TaxID=2036037 RepID=UPI003EC0AC29